MTNLIYWPKDILRPVKTEINLVPFTRSGGPSLSGVEHVTKTDRGWWKLNMSRVQLYNQNTRRCWNSIRTSLNGKSGLVVVPAHSFDSAPYDQNSELSLVSFSDSSIFTDGTHFSENTIFVKTVGETSIGATSIVLNSEVAGPDLSGTRFSIDHALYELGAPTDISGTQWTMPIFPAIRRVIPDDTELEFDNPTCICRLASDDAMNVSLSYGNFDEPAVSFEEATDFWSDLAAGDIDSPFLEDLL